MYLRTIRVLFGVRTNPDACSPLIIVFLLQLSSFFKLVPFNLTETHSIRPVSQFLAIVNCRKKEVDFCIFVELT